MAVDSDCTHQVQFYIDPTYLAQRIANHLATSLANNGAGIVIARPATNAAITEELTAAGVDVDAMLRDGRLELLDAAATLALFMVDGAPDRERFDQVIGARLAKHRGRRIHAYGEMVDLLLIDGKIEAMLALERIWTDTCRRYETVLLCGYRLAAFSDPSQAPTFASVCEHHDTVASERFPTQTPSNEAGAMIELERRTLTLESEIAARTRIERRMQLLLELSSELAAARTREVVFELLLDKGMKAVGAKSFALWRRVDDTIQLLAVSSMFADNTESFTTLPLSANVPLAEVVRTGEAIFLGSPAEYRERYPDSYERVAAMLPYPEFAFAMLPLKASPNDGDETIGGACFTYDHHREFGPSDRAFKAIVARQAALALERVELHEHERTLREAAEAARAETELLYALSATVNRADTLEPIFESALETVERGAYCDRSAILLFDAADKMRFRAQRGLSATYVAAVDGHSPWSRTTIEPAPVLVDDTETDPAWAAYRDVFRAEGIRALAFIPLVQHHKLIGKLMLYRNQPAPFNSHDLQFASTIAVHVALAVERTQSEQTLARAFSEERAAHLEAEEATRAREEILSVVSHDLRNPLGTVLIGASTLLQVDVDRVRVRNIASRIHRQAERMSRLIEDLVDFAAIQTGQVALSRGEHSPTEILDAASDIFAPMADERGLVFQANVTGNLPMVQCDSERAVQVISNLLANAFKVTPRGGSVAIGCEPKDRDVVFYVKDTGPGIGPEDIPRLFERFWRGKSPSYKGTGLGLSIARGLVDAHGGKIWAESQLGVGSTFYFSLSR